MNKSIAVLFVSFIVCLPAACGHKNRPDWQAPVTDITAPFVSSTNPLDMSSGVAVNTKITAIFSEAIDPASVTALEFTLTQNIPVPLTVSGSVATVGKTAIFTPDNNLSVGTVYKAAITNGVKDLAGNSMLVEKTWVFETGFISDTTPIEVSFVNPADLGTNVSLNSDVSVTFNEAVDPTTVNSTTFSLTDGFTLVDGSVTASNSTGVFNPTFDLLSSWTYTATVTTGVTDLAGNALLLNKTWTFTTGTTSAQGPAPVNLGTAGNFAVLAKSGISTVPTSVITGDIGVSPIDQTALTGFSETMDASNEFSTSPQVVGKIYAADYSPPTPTYMTTAVSDMEIAFTDAAGRTVPAPVTELGAGEIGGLTLAPGLYKWGTDLLISTTVTLSGGPDDVWIFQISGKLTQASATQVVLAGGAQPKNIFWQVFGPVDVGTTASFNGVILCQTAINFATGSSGNTILLAQTGVTLDQNIITQP